MHLVYTFGELTKSAYISLAQTPLTPDNNRSAFFELPAEMNTKSGRDRVRRISINKAQVDEGMASGRTTPNSTADDEAIADVLPGVYYGGKERINYDQYPLTPLGHLLTLCSTSGIASYPHPSVTLQFFETGVRYVEFWKAKDALIQPMYEAMLDQRGIHHPDEHVRRRCFYLFSKFVKECKNETNPELAPLVLESMRVSDVIVLGLETQNTD